MAKKFMVGTSPRSLHDVYGKHLAGGTWYSPDDVGVSENVLKKEFPFLIWEKSKEAKEIKKEEKKPKPIVPTKEELEAKAKKIGFSKFRKWAKNKFKVTGRSIEGIIEDIISGKKEIS